MKRVATEVVDLTDIGEESNTTNARRRVERGESSSSSSQGEALLTTRYGSGHAIGRSPSIATSSSLSQSSSGTNNNNNDDENDDDVSEEYYGFIKVKVVGIKYYTGILTDGENVLLMREPSNPYDKNALAVFNIVHQQAGHVEAVASAVLAPLIDKGKLFVEGVLGKQTNNWSIPLILHCYGSPEDSESVKAVLQRTWTLKVEKKKEKSQGDRKGKSKKGESSSDREVMERLTSQPDSILGIPLDHKDLPESDIPKGITTPLFPHQRTALTWMKLMEKPRPASLFWEQSGKNYHNIATSSVVTSLPTERCRGGLLGDQMGLGKSLEIISLIVDQKKPNCGPTLIVCPLSLLGTWESQIIKHTEEDLLSVYIYHANRLTDPKAIQKYDIVITTYNILSSEFVAGGGNQTSPIYKIKWNRVVLDEAHFIKNRKAKMAIAVCEIPSELRWALSGTPIQNKIDDLYSLCKFLRVDLLDDHTWWNRIIARPVKNYELDGFVRIKALLQMICMRRIKEGLVKLPSRTVYLQHVTMSKEEREIYTNLEEQGTEIFDKFLEQGTLMNNYAQVLQLLLRLRQACDHPSLVKAILSSFTQKKVDNVEKNEALEKVIELMKNGELGDEYCPICFDVGPDPLVTKCGHIFHKKCILRALESSSEKKCPLCRTLVNPSEFVPLENFQHEPSTFSKDTKKGKSTDAPIGSAKTEAVIKDLFETWKTEPSTKVVIFSQWTSFLDILMPILTFHKIKFTTLDGRLTSDQRQTAIKKFEEDETVKVFLISLRAGGVGLTLTSANRVYLCDPYWNPMVEEQCIDRVHRLGQTKAVSVIRFVCKDSVEERIIKLQEKKLELIRTALEPKTAKEIQEMRLEDLTLLFNRNRKI